jgi:hypothetical protein
MGKEIYYRRVLRSYWGADKAAPLLEYLNARPRKKSDPVKVLLQANKDLLAPMDTPMAKNKVYVAVKIIRSVLQRTRLRPFFGLKMVQAGIRRSPGRIAEAEERLRRGIAEPGVDERRIAASWPKMLLDREHWIVEWEPMGRVTKQGQAINACIELGKLGLLKTVKQCRREKCGKTFFGQFSHRNFCSAECRRAHLRSTPEWRKGRAEYAKRYRRTIKKAIGASSKGRE